MTIHYTHVFEPWGANRLGSAMRHGDASDIAHLRAESYNEQPVTAEGADAWRSLLLRKSQQDEENE